MSAENQHYVYVYRSKSGKPLYVGYGASVVRSAAHLGKNAHNQKLTQALGSDGYTVEIAGPFGDELRARAVETALISAYRLEPTLCNVNKGHESWRFRALGVPNEFVRRVDQPTLDRDAWRSLAKKAEGIIVVNINDCDLGDGRRGDLLANVPANAELAQRVDRYWQLRGHAERTWVSSSQRSPGLLVGVSGRGAMRMVIASMRIDRHSWGAAVSAAHPHGLLAVPLLLKPDDKLDAYQLRGRRVDVNAGLRFGALRHELFIVIDAAGRTVKGGRK
jgi:hypothetical protein